MVFFSFFLLSHVLRIIVTNLRRVPPEIARPLALLVSFSFVLLLLLSPVSMHTELASIGG